MLRGLAGGKSHLAISSTVHCATEPDPGRASSRRSSSIRSGFRQSVLGRANGSSFFGAEL
jgi:hypothetical protein